MPNNKYYAYSLTILTLFTRAAETDSDVIAEVMEKMGLNKDMPPQEKLDAMCLMFKQTLTENVQ